jgi:formate-dependent phosphoribosylglycinamide formyltransferase (GAR transformylase)
VSPDSNVNARVLLVATTTGYQIRSFGEAAETLGVRLIFASDRCDQLEDPWWDAAIPIRFHELGRSTEAVVSGLRQSPPHGVLAVGDRPTLLAARIADAFGLPGNPPHAAAASRNKLASRDAWQSAGLLTPTYRVVPLEGDAHAFARTARFPVVIKPLALSGSRGVMRADNHEQFIERFERLRALLQSPDVRSERDVVHARALIESFIPGREFAVEGVLTRGTFTPFAIFDKPDPLDGPFFEETIYITPSRAAERDQQAIIKSVATAAHALGLWHGPIHAECRVNDSGVYMLEIAARPIGGLCSKALRFNDDRRSLEEVLLRHAIGEDVSGFVRERSASGVMMIPIPKRGIFRGVDGVDEARRVDGVEEILITAKPDVLLVPLPEGRSYLGFIFARGDEPQTVDRAIREAHATLRFAIEREVAVVP